MALSGIASFYKSRVGAEYIAGLWSTEEPGDFLAQLLWRVHDKKFDLDDRDPTGDGEARPSRRRLSYCGPTWSWVAVTGFIDMRQYEEDDKPAAVVCDIDLKVEGADLMGSVRSATLQIEGPLLKATITWEGSEQVEWDSFWKDIIRLEIDGLEVGDSSSMIGFMVPDAYVEDSWRDLIHSGPGPLDADSTYEQPSPGASSPDGRETMETYLLGILHCDYDLECLWLRPTGRREDEFQRIGIIKLKTRERYETFAYASKRVNLV